ncbi:MAG: hypothetical protein RI571_08545 [Roseovarius sp.]|nr:hypothetical protein [Roseovarius sp.]
MTRSDIAALALIAAASAAPAQQPLSAIDWLDSPGAAGRADRPLPPPAEPPVSGSTDIPDVDVMPLDAALPDAAGLLPAASTGLPRTLWRDSTTSALVTALDGLPDRPLPAVQALFYTLLLTEADAPFDAGSDARFLSARLDALRRYGAVSPALALVERAGPARASLFDHWLGLALLDGSEAAPCSALKRDPALSTAYAARVYCTARAGDWQTAALTFDAAKAVGALTPVEEQLLAVFLSPEAIDDATLPPPPRDVTPLTFRLFEAAGAPLATGSLPRAFAVADLRGTAGWKAEIEAAERLVRRQALPENRLLGLYTAREPAASGGVWDRAAMVQRVHTALRQGDTRAVAGVLPRAWPAMRDAGLGIAFAQLFGADLPQRDLPRDQQPLALRIGLLSPAYESIATSRRQTGGMDGETAFLVDVALGRVAPDAGTTPLQRAIATAFAASGPAPDHRPLIEAGKLGEAIIAAARQLETARRGDRARLGAALRSLRAVGLEDTARRAALQLLILRRPA